MPRLAVLGQKGQTPQLLRNRVLAQVRPAGNEDEGAVATVHFFATVTDPLLEYFYCRRACRDQSAYLVKMLIENG
jgi:hypothetical protein